MSDLRTELAALADEYADRSTSTESCERYPWGVASDDLRDLLARHASEPAAEPARFYDVVMTTLPGPDGEFVELEDQDGRSVGRNIGAEWVDAGDGFHRLRIPINPAPEPAAEDVEALTRTLQLAPMTPYEDGKGGWLFRDSTPAERAERLLASDWLAQRDARIKAEAWGEGAREVQREAHRRFVRWLSLRDLSGIVTDQIGSVKP